MLKVISLALNPVGFTFGVWLYYSSFKNKFLSNLLFLQSFLKFLELSKSIFSTCIRKKKIHMIARRKGVMWKAERFQLILFLWRSEVHFPFIRYVTLHPTSLTFQLITLFPNPCPLGNRFFITSAILCCFLQLFRFFKILSLQIMKTSSYYGKTWCSSESCFFLCLQDWSWTLGISREFCQ